MIITTLTWNGLDKLSALHPGLIKNLEATGMDYEWRIRSNGCKDGTVETVEGWMKENDKIKLMKVDHNRSNFAQGMNSLATDVKDDDVVLLMNNDVTFTEGDDLKKMMKVMNDNQAAGIVGARLLFTNSDLIQHNGVAFSKERWGRMPWHIHSGVKVKDAPATDRRFQAVTAAVQLVRGACWNQLKGFDETFSWAFEDVDLCLRAGLAEWQVWCCGDTKIRHEESASLKKNNVNKLFMGSNVSRFKEKWWKDGSPTYNLDYERHEKDS